MPPERGNIRNKIYRAVKFPGKGAMGKNYTDRRPDDLQPESLPEFLITIVVRTGIVIISIITLIYIVVLPVMGISGTVNNIIEILPFEGLISSVLKVILLIAGYTIFAVGMIFLGGNKVTGQVGIGVLSLLCIICLPSLLYDNMAEERLSYCESNLKNIATALEMYATDNDGDYPLSIEYLTKNDGNSCGSYIKSLPVCPKTNIVYGYNTAPEKFILYCGHPDAHINIKNISTKGYWPQYTPKEGLTYSHE